MNNFFLALTFIVTFLFPITVQAQDNNGRDAIAVVVETEGNVYVQRGDNTPSPLAINDPLFRQDIVITGDDARTHILFIDDTEVTLGADAVLNVENYVFDESGTSKDKARFNFLRGAFVYVSGLIAKKNPSEVKLETSYGSIGIRGTTVWGGELDGEFGVLVLDGEVTVATDRGRINVGTGQGTMIRDRMAIPTRPKVWAQEKIMKATVMVALRRTPEVRERIKEIKARHEDLNARHKSFLKMKRKEMQRERQEAPAEPQKKTMIEKLKENRAALRTGNASQNMLEESGQAETAPLQLAPETPPVGDKEHNAEKRTEFEQDQQDLKKRLEERRADLRRQKESIQKAQQERRAAVEDQEHTLRKEEERQSLNPAHLQEIRERRYMRRSKN